MLAMAGLYNAGNRGEQTCNACGPRLDRHKHPSPYNQRQFLNIHQPLKPLARPKFGLVKSCPAFL